MEDERYATNWKWNSDFLKVFQKEKREHMFLTKPTPAACAIMLYLENYIKPVTNRVAMLDGSRITNKNISEITNLSNRVIKYTLNELEEKHFIKRIGNRQAREIYYNPYLACASSKIDARTVGLFEDYIEFKERVI